jgi:hypothetical protein
VLAEPLAQTLVVLTRRRRRRRRQPSPPFRRSALASGRRARSRPGAAAREGPASIRRHQASSSSTPQVNPSPCRGRRIESVDSSGRIGLDSFHPGSPLVLKRLGFASSLPAGACSCARVFWPGPVAAQEPLGGRVRHVSFERAQSLRPAAAIWRAAAVRPNRKLCEESI